MNSYIELEDSADGIAQYAWYPGFNSQYHKQKQTNEITKVDVSRAWIY